MLVKIALSCAMINPRQTRQEREKVSNKHVYDNSFDPLVSFFLSLGVWFSLESALFERSESLFQEEEKDANAASQCHCSQLTELFAQRVS